MYKKIEELYKKHSPYNLVRKDMFIIYLVGVVISLVFNFYNNYILMIITMLIMLFSIIKRCEKILKTKLYISLNTKNKNEKKLKDIINDKEKDLFKKYVQKENLYNEKSILCILEHYRTLFKNKITSSEILTILSIILPIPLSFIKDGEFDINGLVTVIPYLICFAIVIFTCYFAFRNFLEMKKMFKGEDGMYERLEVIFSELYIESLKEKDTPKKKTIKIRNKKSKNTLPEGALKRQKQIKNP